MYMHYLHASSDYPVSIPVWPRSWHRQIDQIDTLKNCTTVFLFDPFSIYLGPSAG